MQPLNCIVIDDEPLAGKGLKEYIDEIDSLKCLAVVHSPAEAIKYLDQVQLMYLDINMPKISGIDFLKQVSHPPLTIITTAYQQYALQSFELDVVDYLLKPISFPRFLKATTKAIDYFKLLHHQKTTSVNDDYFFVKCNGILEKVVLSDIIAIESLANYVTIHCTGRKLIAYLTLKQIRDYLPSKSFIQVHKSFIVAVDKIERVDHDSIYIGSLEIPVGSNYKDTVMAEILNKVLKR